MAATTKGSNADKTLDQSLSPTSATALPATPEGSNEGFPWGNPTLFLNCEVEQAKLDKAPPFEPLRSLELETEAEEEAQERKSGLLKVKP